MATNGKTRSIIERVAEIAPNADIRRLVKLAGRTAQRARYHYLIRIYCLLRVVSESCERIKILDYRNVCPGYRSLALLRLEEVSVLPDGATMSFGA